MKIDISSAVRGIEALRAKVTQALVKAVDRTNAEMLEGLRDRTSYEFQTVPSYLEWHKYYPGLGIKSYPPETKATFARSTGKGVRAQVIGSLTSGQLPIQQSIFEPHALHDKLTMEPAKVRNGVVEGSVGYPPGAEVENPEILWVMFGTDRMIARPFLEEELRDVQKFFRAAISEELQEALRG